MYTLQFYYRDCFIAIGEQGRILGITLGLHPLHALPEQRPMVLSHQLCPHHCVPVGNGGYDIDPVTAQRHRALQQE